MSPGHVTEMHMSSSELERLRVLHEMQILDSPSEPLFDEICEEMRQHFRVPMAAISLLDADRQWFKAHPGIDFQETPRAIAFCSHTILADQILVVPDARRDGRFAGNPLVTHEPFLRFYAGCPLIYPLPLGSLDVLDHRPRIFTPGDQTELQDFADRVILALAKREFMLRPRPVHD